MNAPTTLDSRRSPARPRVVVVGGGFGGLQVVRGLRRAPVDVTLVDRQNFPLFQPLAYQVATGALSPAEIAVPAARVVQAPGATCASLLGRGDRVRPRRPRVVLGRLPERPTTGRRARPTTRWSSPAGSQLLLLRPRRVGGRSRPS